MNTTIEKRLDSFENVIPHNFPYCNFRLSCAQNVEKVEVYKICTLSSKSKLLFTFKNNDLLLLNLGHIQCIINDLEIPLYDINLSEIIVSYLECKLPYYENENDKYIPCFWHSLRFYVTRIDPRMPYSVLLTMTQLPWNNSRIINCESCPCYESKKITLK